MGNLEFLLKISENLKLKDNLKFEKKIFET